MSETGLVLLEELFIFASTDRQAEGMYGLSQKGREYGRLVAKLAASIPDEAGFYILGKYEPNLLWRTIYLGKAGYGKMTNLQSRIVEELKDERAFVWAGPHTGLSEKAVRKKWLQLYSKSVGCKGTPNHIDRSLRKAGSTHIFWVTTPDLDNEGIKLIESDLIETLNPLANMQRPAPSSGLQKRTIRVISDFKKRIHESRHTIVKLKNIGKRRKTTDSIE